MARLQGFDLLRQRCSVFFSEAEPASGWFEGSVADYDGDTSSSYFGKHHLEFDDGDKRWLDLAAEEAAEHLRWQCGTWPTAAQKQGRRSSAKVNMEMITIGTLMSGATTGQAVRSRPAVKLETGVMGVPILSADVTGVEAPSRKRSAESLEEPGTEEPKIKAEGESQYDAEQMRRMRERERYQTEPSGKGRFTFPRGCTKDPPPITKVLGGSGGRLGRFVTKDVVIDGVTIIRKGEMYVSTAVNFNPWAPG